MRDDDDEQLKIELLSQWKLEAEFRNFQKMMLPNMWEKKTIESTLNPPKLADMMSEQPLGISPLVKLVNPVCIVLQSLIFYPNQKDTIFNIRDIW